MGRIIDITGKVYGLLKVESFAGKDRHHKARWNCICSCGRRCVINGRNLRIGATKSCGCYQILQASKANTIHGKSKSAEFRVWKAMLSRCHNKNQKSYKNYGRLGIKVCSRWKKSFTAFLKDMGDRPTPTHTIERISPKIGYQPSNCRWATRKEQNRNKKNNRMIMFNGKRQCLAAWAEELNVPYSRLIARLNRGWSVRETLTTA